VEINAVVKPQYENPQYKLTINSTSGGTTNPAGTSLVNIGQTINIQAIPGRCHDFLH